MMLFLFYNCMVAFACCYCHTVDKSSSHQKVSSASDLQEREYSQCILMPIAPLVVYCEHVVVNMYDLGKEWSVMWCSFVSSISSTTHDMTASSM